MADYISRADIMKKLTAAEAQTAIRDMDGGEAYNWFLELVGFAPAADVEPVRHWIPCSERMPNPGERVLATDGGFVGEMYIGKRGEWRRYNVTYIEDLMALDILWWMPLPEAPDEI